MIQVKLYVTKFPLYVNGERKHASYPKTVRKPLCQSCSILKTTKLEVHRLKKQGTAIN